MAEPAALLHVEGLSKHFGAVPATDNLNLHIAPGELHALIGPNGAGKTTAVAQIAGELRPDSGQIVFAGHTITDWPIQRRVKLGLARSYQITSLFPQFTALDNVALAVQAHQGHSLRAWRNAHRDPRLREPARLWLEKLGLAGRDEIPAAELAHGEQRQLELAMALATNPRLLLLDEPMAGMGSEDSQRLISLLRSLKGDYTILLVEHDMDAVFALADRITVLVYGQAIACDTPQAIRANEQVRTAYLGEQDV